jgi:hypothetical protein
MGHTNFKSKPPLLQHDFSQPFQEPVGWKFGSVFATATSVDSKDERSTCASHMDF